MRRLVQGPVSTERLAAQREQPPRMQLGLHELLLGQRQHTVHGLMIPGSCQQRAGVSDAVTAGTFTHSCSSGRRQVTMLPACCPASRCCSSHATKASRSASPSLHTCLGSPVQVMANTAALIVLNHSPVGVAGQSSKVVPRCGSFIFKGGGQVGHNPGLVLGGAPCGHEAVALVGLSTLALCRINHC